MKIPQFDFLFSNHSTGNEATGIPHAEPVTTSLKGPNTAGAIEINRSLQLYLPGMELPVPLVLVTPAMLEALPREGVADKELSALLRGNRLVPVMDEVTFEQLVKVSPLLASRSGLSTKENTWPEIIEQIADLVNVHRPAT